MKKTALSTWFLDEIMNSAVERAMAGLKEGRSFDIFFINADCLFKAQRDEVYRNILNTADTVLPDGIGLKLATKFLGNAMRYDCNGTDFSPLLMRRGAEEGYKMYFLGARENVAKRVAENMRRQIPEIQIAGTHSGYLSNDDDVVKEINDSGADILFVAMGVPRQEKWIARNRSRLKPRLCLGVGALFDYLSGRIPRAPKFMRAIHLEWLWRIFIEPKRMFKRYIVDGAKLFCIVLKYKITSRPASLG